MFRNKSEIKKIISGIKKQGLYKDERVITSPQGSEVRVGRRRLLNFCANNYLGLANDRRIITAAINGIKKYGYGLSSVRFICGTQNIHKQLEEKVSRFLGTEDTILYTSCFDANTGLFETLLGKEDAVVSDALNHASIIDGIRLCKAMRFIYKHSDMQDLEDKLREARKAKAKKILIATDGVFSMQGDFANLPEICRLAKKYNALVMVDDSHATGFIGDGGRGTAEYFNVMKDVDVITSTFGKALGGATGGFTSGRKEIIALLRQKSRPYLFSNSLPPVVVSASLKAIDIIERSSGLRRKLVKNTQYFRKRMKDAGFDIIDSNHPIVAVMLYDAKLAKKMADKLLEEGIYVVGFSYPVVPKGEARIRVQISAAHDKKQIDALADAFARMGREMGILKN